MHGPLIYVKVEFESLIAYFFGWNIIYLLKRTKVWLVTDALKKDSHEKIKRYDATTWVN